ncbi:hypothetical protein QL285_096895 [Trifolium repens]|nr:hypothetical protein QL285_096895 [Trifolium repens]
MVVMEDDDSFKKPGAIPFKWEIKPGLPIPHHHNLLESPSLKLRPPPLGSYKLSPVEPRTRSFRSSPKVRSERWRFEKPLAQPEIVASSGCFFSPFLKRLGRTKTTPKRVVEPDYTSELEMLGRWSFSSTTKSLSPFRPSTVSSSIASSPQPVGDVEWAGFGLF